jgi:hypothetical protein
MYAVVASLDRIGWQVVERVFHDQAIFWYPSCPESDHVQSPKVVFVQIGWVAAAAAAAAAAMSKVTMLNSKKWLTRPSY